jgi:FAD/FMN-containing dehydrogenase
MDISELSASIVGTIVAEGDDGWDAARRFHSGIGEPVAVVRAADVADVREAVVHAVASGLPIEVRGGGHSAGGEGRGALTIDLQNLDAVEVDGDLVHVGGGATWRSVAAVLADHGLGLSSGDTASVGVGGLTLGGGIGWMTRAWGLACDQLVGVQIVSAAGDVVEATDATHPDLLWALRGGGGNFGVVTRFDFRAHPLDGVVFTTFRIDGDARPVLAALSALLREAPRELTVTYMDVPAMDPSAPAGATIGACWIGTDEDAAREALAPLRDVPGLVEVESGATAYPDILLETPEFDPDSPMPGFVGGNTLLVDLDATAIDRLTGFRASTDASVLFLRSVGGAFGDIAQDDSAFPARDATWFAMAGGFDIPGLVDDAERARLTALWDDIEVLGQGVYGNFTTSTDSAIAAKMYPPATRERLAAVKRVWDPGNAFSRNHNIVPA